MDNLKEHGSNVKHRQEKHNQNREKPSFSSHYFAAKKNIFDFLHKTSHAVLDIFDKILYLSDKFPVVYVTQESLADYAGVTREYANHCIKKLVESGALITENCGFKKPLRYYVSNVFFLKANRIELKKLLPALSIPSLTGLLLQEFTLSHKRTYEIDILRRMENIFYKMLEEKIRFLKRGVYKQCYKNMLSQAFMYYKKRHLSSLLGSSQCLPGVRTCPPGLRTNTKSSLSIHNLRGAARQTAAPLFHKEKNQKRDTCVRDTRVHDTGVLLRDLSRDKLSDKARKFLQSAHIAL